MKSFFSIILMVMVSLFAHGQNKILNVHLLSHKTKQTLDGAAIGNWLTVTSGGISNNGKYAFFFKDPVTDVELKHKVVIKSTDTNWHYETSSIVENELSFSDDSRHAIYRSVGNELWLVRLGGAVSKIGDSVLNFQMAKQGKDDYVLYKTSENNLICRNLKTDAEISLAGVSTYQYIEGQKAITAISVRGDVSELLQYTLGSKIPHKVGHFKNVSSLIIDNGSGKVCFRDGHTWYVLHPSGTEAEFIALNFDENLKGLIFNGFERFEAEGNLLIARFTEPKPSPLNPAVNNLKIFSYQDPYYYSVRNAGEKTVASYCAAYGLTTRKFTRLEYPYDQLKMISKDGSKILISHIEGQISEYYWNILGRRKDYILDLLNGNKIQVKEAFGNWISPDGKWLISQSILGGDLKSLDTKMVVVKNLTENLNIPRFDDSGREEQPFARGGRGLGFYNWTADYRYMIIYDSYDIWRLDPSGDEKPLNLTKGLGRKTRTCFRFIDSGPAKYFSNGESVVITAFDDNTKDNGFYQLTIGKPETLRKLTMGPYLYQAPWRIVTNWQPPVKARDANVWLIPRQRADESRNLFVTTDFKKFTGLSDVYPERDYHWYTSELFSFKTKDGLDCKAILYKPDNYDPNKKYPVLFNFYQGPFSEKLHEYHAPAWTDSYYFNYSMMLARGYMVCLTDTRQPVIGETAHGLVDAIEGAADELAKRPYIDSNAYGASGGSFGGYGVNCLAALSNKFKALVPISGVSDVIGQSYHWQEHAENRQMGMGVSLGTDPKRYLYNSPIAFSKKVNTPLLIVNTLSDGNVPSQQGIEWFISLRREGKRAWMLQYQENGHGISELANQKDLYQRMNQFFDHYLKGETAPVWMTRGISINDRGVKDGFELDTEIKTPEPSKLYQAQ